MNLNLRKIGIYSAINLIIILAVIIIVSGKPKITGINEIHFIKTEGNNIYAQVEAKINNPNFFMISGKEIFIKLMDGENFFGEGEIESISLPARSEETVKIKLKVNINTLKDVFEKQNDSVLVKANLMGHFNPLFFISEINSELFFSKKEIQRLAMTTFFRNNMMKLESAFFIPQSPVKSKLILNIVLNNTFNFECSIQKMEAEILPSENSETVIAEWKVEDPILLSPKNPFHLKGELDVHHIQLLKGGIEKIGTKFNNLWLKGTANIALKENNILPINFGCEVNINENGIKIAPSKHE